MTKSQFIRSARSFSQFSEGAKKLRNVKILADLLDVNSVHRGLETLCLLLTTLVDISVGRWTIDKIDPMVEVLPGDGDEPKKEEIIRILKNTATLRMLMKSFGFYPNGFGTSLKTTPFVCSINHQRRKLKICAVAPPQERRGRCAIEANESSFVRRHEHFWKKAEEDDHSLQYLMDYEIVEPSATESFAEFEKRVAEMLLHLCNWTAHVSSCTKCLDEWLDESDEHNPITEMLDSLMSAEGFAGWNSYRNFLRPHPATTSNTDYGCAQLEQLPPAVTRFDTPRNSNWRLIRDQYLPFSTAEQQEAAEEEKGQDESEEESTKPKKKAVGGSRSQTARTARTELPKPKEKAKEPTKKAEEPVKEQRKVVDSQEPKGSPKETAEPQKETPKPKEPKKEQVEPKETPKQRTESPDPEKTTVELVEPLFEPEELPQSQRQRMESTKRAEDPAKNQKSRTEPKGSKEKPVDVATNQKKTVVPKEVLKEPQEELKETELQERVVRAEQVETGTGPEDARLLEGYRKMAAELPELRDQRLAVDDQNRDLPYDLDSLKFDATAFRNQRAAEGHIGNAFRLYQLLPADHSVLWRPELQTKLPQLVQDDVPTAEYLYELNKHYTKELWKAISEEEKEEWRADQEALEKEQMFQITNGWIRKNPPPKRKKAAKTPSEPSVKKPK